MSRPCSACPVLRSFREHRGQPIASSALMAPISAAFVTAIKAFAQSEGVALIDFKHGQRKGDIAKEHLARFSSDEGILFIGRAQEKVSAFRTEKRHNLRISLESDQPFRSNPISRFGVFDHP